MLDAALSRSFRLGELGHEFVVIERNIKTHPQCRKQQMCQNGIDLIILLNTNINFVKYLEIVDRMQIQIYDLKEINVNY